MKKVLILSEVKQRELQASVLLKLVLQRRGYEVEIANFLDSVLLKIRLFKPDVIINNGMRSDENFWKVFYYPKMKFKSRIITIYAEQITSNVNKEGFYNNDNILASTDAHIAWGDGFAEILKMKKSVNNEKVFITGSHRLDVLSILRNSNIKSKLGSLYKLDTNKKWILIAGNIVLGQNNVDKDYNKYLEDSQRAFTKDILRLANAYPDILFIFRSHPATSEKQYDDEKRIYSQSENIYYTNDYSISDWLHSVNGVITWQSTSSIEAWALKKPVVAYLPITGNVNYDAWQTKYTTKATDFISLANTVNSILENKFTESIKIIDARREYLKNWYYTIDFKSSERIVDVVDKVMDNECVKIQSNNTSLIKKKFFAIWVNEIKNLIIWRLRNLIKTPKSSYITNKDINIAEKELRKYILK